MKSLFGVSNPNHYLLPLLLVVILIGKSEAQGLKEVVDSSECVRLQRKVHSLAGGNDNQQTYDTARFAVENCASQYNPAFPIEVDFGAATGACQYLSNDKNRWPPYREWLKKVLYLRIDSFYYCEDVMSMLSTFQYFNANRGRDNNGAIAVLQFLLDSGKCFSFFPNSIHERIAAGRREQRQAWRDTVKDSLATPFAADTVLPSLEDLDLQILRGPQYAAVKNGFTPSTMKKLLSVSSSENPFRSETTLRFELADAEYMKLELYDLLGNNLYSDTKLCGEGNNTWHIDGKSLPHSNIYARLSTIGGEVKTIKLTRE